MDAMKTFFLFVLGTVIPSALMAEPIIYFVSIALGIYVCGMIVILCHGFGNKRK